MEIREPMSVTVHNGQGMGIAAWLAGLMSFSGSAPRRAMIGTVCMLLLCLTVVRVYGTLWWLPSQLVVAGTLLGLLWIFAATSVRRLHDIGRSGHWFWVLLMPVVSQCATILLCCQPTRKDGNPFAQHPPAYDKLAPPMWQRVVLCLALAWLLFCFVIAGVERGPTDQERCLELLATCALPMYVLWMPWWLWITFRDRRSTEPSRFWPRRLLVAVSVTWLLCVLCIALGDESMAEALIVLLLFGIAPVGLLWLAYGLLRMAYRRTT
ncbi:Uncharacterized membrane protein YhaH, DUF805 family [Dyella jiangningensis]|nr:uncharacterized membrane protein YhaH (DUF805 family) [Dyella sp. AtDHG13]SDK16570.1 Uncharacterized membrane protein YhaH, DUF805 family [Dyella jiangningensis]